VSARWAAAGQALPLAALIMPVVTLLLVAILETGSFLVLRLQLQDSLQHALRAAVQQFDYAGLAQGQAALRGPACGATTIAAATADCAQLLTLPVEVLRRNLAQQVPTAARAEELAAAVRWTVLPDGGGCAGTDISSNRPLICAELRVTVRSPFGLRQRELLIRAAETLDVGAE
jgi:hypothetical protein